MSTAAYTVRGMTCDHCVHAVHDEVTALPTVTGAEVDLASGRLVVESSEPVDFDVVRAAVEEAGYELEGASS